MTVGIVSTYTIKSISPLHLFFHIFPVEYKYDDVSLIFFKLKKSKPTNPTVNTGSVGRQCKKKLRLTTVVL